MDVENCADRHFQRALKRRNARTEECFMLSLLPETGIEPVSGLVSRGIVSPFVLNTE